jgi:hypothetical protein
MIDASLPAKGSVQKSALLPPITTGSEKFAASQHELSLSYQQMLQKREPFDNRTAALIGT